MNSAFEHRIQAVRQFNRFYTRQIGVLQEHLLGSDFSLAEMRVLYELAHREKCTAKEIGECLGLDPGYLSRILAGFAKMRLIRRERLQKDARHLALQLTEKGRSAFEPLNLQSSQQVGELLSRMPEAEQSKLVRAMGDIEHAVAGNKISDPTLVLRPHRPGDIGWVIHRHGVLYAQEYGWDETFEALVAEIAALFIKNFDARCDRCWIAERDSEPVGTVFLVKYTEQVAKLRLLLVEPHARGLGVGRRLVEECIRFARLAGYRKITLWTQSNLTAARNLYRRAGFKLVKEEPQRAFGADLVSETWELDL